MDQIVTDLKIGWKLILEEKKNREKILLIKKVGIRKRIKVKNKR